MLTPLTLGLISAVLIALGLGLVLRDMWLAKPKPPAAAPATTVEPPETATKRPETGRTAKSVTARQSSAPTGQDFADSAAVTIVHKTQPPPPRTLRPGGDPTTRLQTIVAGESPAFDQLQSAIAAIGNEALTDDAQAGAEGQKWPNVEKRWMAVAGELDAAVAEVNNVLAGIDLQIGPAGESAWSFKNRGFGSFRRILLGGRSIAWLRTELMHSGQLSFKTRAHTVEQALLNAAAQVKGDGAQMRVLLDGLSTAIRPAAEYAAWTKPRQQAEAQAQLDGWAEVDAVATQALSIAAQAFKEAGADLSEASAPTWDATAARHRWLLAMKVGGNLIGRVKVDLVKRALEVAVDDPDKIELARRQAIDTLGITPHALAEVIANCAWPTVAHALAQQTGANALGYAG